MFTMNPDYTEYKIDRDYWYNNGLAETRNVLDNNQFGAWYQIFGAAGDSVKKYIKPVEPRKSELEELIPIPKTPNLPNLPNEPLEPTMVEEPKYKDLKLPEKPTPVDTRPLPIEPVKEKDPILKLITGAPGRSEVPGTPPPVVPNSNPKPIFEPNIPVDYAPEPKKPELLSLLPKVTIPTDSVNATRGSVVVKKYVFEYLNSSQGIGAGIRKFNDKKSSYGNSLTLRNLK